MMKPRWIITYRVDAHLRDRDNYPLTDMGEYETREGDTLQEAIHSLIRFEATDKLLRDYIDPGYDYYNSIEIISIYKIIKEVELDFEKIPTITRMLKDMKETIKKEKAKLKADKDQKKIAEEKRKLKELLKIHGVPCS